MEQAIIREVEEETSLSIEIQDVVAVNEAFIKEKGHHTLFITFKAEIADGKVSIPYQEDILEVKWLGLQTANELLPYYRGGIEKLLKSSSSYTYQR